MSQQSLRLCCFLIRDHFDWLRRYPPEHSENSRFDLNSICWPPQQMEAHLSAKLVPIKCIITIPILNHSRQISTESWICFVINLILKIELFTNERNVETRVNISVLHSVYDIWLESTRGTSLTVCLDWFAIADRLCWGLLWNQRLGTASAIHLQMKELKKID